MMRGFSPLNGLKRRNIKIKISKIKYLSYYNMDNFNEISINLNEMNTTELCTLYFKIKNIRCKEQDAIIDARKKFEDQDDRFDLLMKSIDLKLKSLVL